MKSVFTDYIRGFNNSKWCRVYKKTQTISGLMKTLLSVWYMKMAANNGGYIGRGMPQA